MAALGDNILANFSILVTSNIDGAVAGLAKLQGSMEGLQATGAAMTAVGSILTVGLTLPIMAVGAASVVSDMEIQKFYQTLQAGAAGSGESITTLEGQFNDLYSKVPQDGQTVANTLLNVSNILGSTWSNNASAIQGFSQEILNLSMVTGESATGMSKAVSDLFDQMHVPASQAVDDLTNLWKAAEQAREPVTQLASDTAQYSQVLETTGLTTQQQIDLMALLNQQGMDDSMTVKALAYGMAELSTGSKTVAPLLSDIAKNLGLTTTAGLTTAQMWDGLTKGIQNGSITMGDAEEAFGPRLTTNIYDAIKGGHLDLTQFQKDMDNNKSSIDSAATASETFSQKLTVLKHDLELALAPLGSTIIDTLEGFMPIAVTLASDVNTLFTAFNKLPAPIKDAALGLAAFLAAAGPVLLIVGSLITAYTKVSTAITTLATKLGILTTDEATTEAATTGLAVETDTATASLDAEAISAGTAGTSSAGAAVGVDTLTGSFSALVVELSLVTAGFYAAYVAGEYLNSLPKESQSQATSDAAKTASKQQDTSGTNLVGPNIDVYGAFENIPNLLGQGGIVKAARGFVTHGPQLVLAGDNPGGMEAFVPLQGGKIPVSFTSTQGSQKPTATFSGDINIINPVLNNNADAQQLGLQIAYSAKLELARAGYSPG